MKFPKEIKTFCPYCNAHTSQKVKIASKAKGRTMAAGARAHARALLGHGGKRAGVKSVKKQGKNQKIILQCLICKKKQERVIGTRTTKKLELKA